MRPTKRILILGAYGQLGSCFRNAWGNALNITYCGSHDVDVTSWDALVAAFEQFRPEVVINCTGYTAVDLAESEKALAKRLNEEAPEHLARLSQRNNAKLIHFSTDYVFDGNAGRPYRETDACHPLNVYSVTKRNGEERVLRHNKNALVLRVSWLYSVYGKNFFKTMLRLAEKGETVHVVNDQVASPTWAPDVVDVVGQLLRQPSLAQPSGILHFSNSGIASWFDFAVEIIRPLHPNVVVRPVDSGYFDTAAARPRYSKLDTCRLEKFVGFRPRHWKNALEEARMTYFETLKTNIDEQRLDGARPTVDASPVRSGNPAGGEAPDRAGP